MIEWSKVKLKDENKKLKEVQRKSFEVNEKIKTIPFLNVAYQAMRNYSSGDLREGGENSHSYLERHTYYPTMQIEMCDPLPIAGDIRNLSEL